MDHLRKATLLLVIVLGLHAMSLQAMEVAPSPVESAMQMQLAVMSAGDEFDEPTQGQKSTNANAKQQSIGKRSIWKAGALSALLPGLGEYYAGHKQKARLFFAGEAVTWIGYASLRIYGSAKEDDYIRFAQTNANAHLEDKSDEIRDMVGYYADINEYNSLGRAFDPERPYLADTPENHWQWQTTDDQAIYRHLKNRSREAYRRSDFFIGIAIVSRVISVVDAIRDVKRANNRLDQDFSQAPVKLEIDPLSATRQVTLSIRTPF
jgi:hypothetical protein